MLSGRAFAAAALLALCATASAGATPAATTPAAALAKSLKGSIAAYYKKSEPELVFTTVECKIAATGRTASCQAHFTDRPKRANGVFRIAATIDTSTGGVHTKTLSVKCADSKTGKTVGCF